MAIRFDKKFNKEIRREIDNINKKYTRARKMGFTHVPKNISVRDVKEQFRSRYATRRELRRQLNEYKRVNISDLSKIVELESGARVSLQNLKTTEKRRIRLYRKVNREIKQMEQRIKGSTLPFSLDELDRLKNIQSKLAQGSRVSESRMRMINEIYTREFSSSKKDAFEDSLLGTLQEQMDFIELDERKQKEILEKLKKVDINTLIRMNRNDEDFADVMDRYKGRNDYNEYDKKVLKNTYENIYNRLDDIIAENMDM